MGLTPRGANSIPPRGATSRWLLEWGVQASQRKTLEAFTYGAFWSLAWGRLGHLAHHHLLSGGLEQFIAEGADEEVTIEFESEVMGLDGHSVIPRDW